MKKFISKRKSMIGKRCLLYLLGTICIFAAEGIRAEGKGIDTEDAKSKKVEVCKQTSVSAAYANVLSGYMEDAKEKEEQPRFSLIYLDSDTTPELVVMYGEAHPDGGYLYSYEDGKAVLVGDSEEWMGYGEYGSFRYIEKEARFWNGHEGFGNVYDEICEWNGEKVLNYNNCYVVPENAIEDAVKSAWETTDKEQKDALYSRLMEQTGCTEDSEPVFDYDDYDADGHYEAFAIYEGQLWFVDADSCEQVSHNEYAYYDFDGKIEDVFGNKCIYLDTEYCATAVLTDIWKLEDGKPVEDAWSGRGEVVCREKAEYQGFVIIRDAYDYLFDAEMEMTLGHTWKPYFFEFQNGEIEQYEREKINRAALEKKCGFDLAGEIEKEGYEIGEIYLWGSHILTVNYSTKLEDGSIQYENVVWDCYGGKDGTGDYYALPGTEQPKTWQEAGFGGSYQ